MRYKTPKLFSTFFCLLICFACSTVDQTGDSSNSNSDKSWKRLANKDYSNKPVNLNLQKDKSNFDKQIEELNGNRGLWNSLNISNYDFYCEHFEEGVGGDLKLTFKVRDKKSVPFENLEYPKPHAYKEFETFEKLFDFVQNSLENGWIVNVKYNKTYGFPEELGVTSSGNGWSSTKIEKFEILK